MNFASTSQKQQLFFAPFWGIKEGKKTELLPPSKVIYFICAFASFSSFHF